MPAQIDVELETVTPLFMGGANPLVPEVRTNSFRGELRYWYRALAAESNLAELQKREAAVFGDTGRASPVLVHAEAIGRFEPQDWRQVSAPPRGGLSDAQRLGLGYLGFPFRSVRGESPRRCIAPGTRIHLTLRVRHASDEEALRQAYVALWLLVNLGGIGTRARRGFGSVATRTAPILDDLPPLAFSGASLASLRDHLEQGVEHARRLVRANAPRTHAHYSILTAQHARIVLANRLWDSWQDALEDFGREMLTYRKPMYPRMVDLRSGPPTDAVAERAAFGLPIPYFDHSVLQPAPAGKEPPPDRRASPLLVKVAKVGEKFTLLFTVFVGAAFLPDAVTNLQTGTFRAAVPNSTDPVVRFLVEVGPRLGNLIRVRIP